jgi:hypothetical protein
MDLKIGDKVWCFDGKMITSSIGTIIRVPDGFGSIEIFIDDMSLDFYEHELYRCPEDKNELLEHLKRRKKSIEYMIKDIEQMI